ncbi:MAG: flagellar hook-basal body complex protein FliE [Lachnospiraceae bacterium]|nr:flagellar hook-basal body complex protein FliE [Lachnospiraceae bacterium]
MNVTAVNGLERVPRYPDKINSVSDKSSNVSFETLFQSAMGLVKETDSLSNKAEEEEIKFAMGMSDSIVDLQAAQQKASLSLQYTVAVRNAVLDAYKELMNLQF